MAARETLDQWAATLDRIGELYSHVHETVADLPEQKVDLAGSASQGAPPPLPGGMKLVLAGPHNLHAPPDATAHPGVFLEKWCAHVGRRSRSIPPGRTATLTLWMARLLWLRERLQWVDAEEDFNAEIRAVHGLLRNVTNADRASRAEEVADRWIRGDTAMRTLQARWRDIPFEYPLTKHEVLLIWPDIDTEFLDRLRWWKAKNRGEAIPHGKYPAGLVRQALDNEQITVA